MRILSTSLLLAAVMAGSAFAACEPAGNHQRADIFPSADQLPANLLRFYIYFPQPMAREGILDHIALRDETGMPVAGVFLENRYDLWSPDRRRLTLLLDPGRVKTGLAAHEALGHALTVGARYTLTVEESARNAGGCPLSGDTVYSFSVAPPDIDPPTPGAWELTVPAAGSLDPLVVDLGSPHDHLSLAYRLRAVGPDGAGVPGAIALGAEESIWRFTPRHPWTAEPHTLTIDFRLEDLAGNRPGVLFDRPVDVAAKDWIRAIPFHPGKTRP